ncbi:MAG: NnrU family protein [Betaproteobacteria bacterium]|nr:NnrU family protein [Betaproteobacteria bacterium]
MDPIAQLALAAAAFLAAHFVSSTPLREALVGKIGEKTYLALYSLAAFAALAWMVWAYRQSPVQPLWPGAKLLPTIVMPFALILLVGGVLGKNPTAVGQGGLLRGADPVRGMLRITRHPVMWAIMLWAATHLLARGSLKGAIFFGSFLVLAALGTRLIDARRARALGADWQRFAARTSNLPFAAIVQGRNRFAAGEIGLLAALSGLILYGGLLIGHAWLFGLRPY